ncbi:MAG: hypothetical protein JNL87_15990 [Burkholderiaceae bacterium]|nr:hypothetical protein [Burkholderiaceae bacterium]
MRRLAFGLLAIMLALAACLSLWPVPVQPVAWQASAAPGYAGPHAVNTGLAGLTLIPQGSEGGRVPGWMKR